jgi:uncharacterized protein involved in outer membrane biogenesis
MNNKLHRLLAGKALRRTVASLLGLITLYFLFGYFGVNPIAQRLLPWIAERKLASRMEVGRVDFDPLRWQLTVSQLRLMRKDGAPLAGFEQLYLDLEADGIFRRAWHLRDIRLSGPSVRMEIGHDGKFNWAELIAKLNEDKTPDSDTIPGVIIDHLLIANGKLHYAENNRPTPFVSDLSPLALELESFSTLPQDRGDYLIAARMPEQGATFRWKGTLGVNPLASAGAVDISGMQLPKLAQALRGSLPLTLTHGQLATAFRYDFAMVSVPNQPDPRPKVVLHDIALKLQQLGAQLNPQTNARLDSAEASLPELDLALHRDGQIHLQDLNLHASNAALEQQSKRLLNLANIEVADVRYDLADNHLDVGKITLAQGNIQAVRGANGVVDWQSVTPATETVAAAPASTAPTPDKSKPFSFSIAQVRVDHWRIGFADKTFVHPLDLGVGNVDVTLAVNGQGDQLVADKIEAGLTDITLKSALAAQPVASLDKLHLGDGRVSLGEHAVRLPSIALSGLNTRVTLDAKQALNWSAILQTPAGRGSTKSAEPAAASPWKVVLDTVRLENAGIRIEDAGSGTPIAFDVQNGRAELRDLSLDLAKPVPLKASLQLKQGGRFEVTGKLAPAPLKAALDLKIEGVPLAPFSPYVNRYAMLKLTDGQAGARGKLTLASGKTLNGQFTGGFAVSNLNVIEESDGRPFLSWKKLSSESFRYTLAPSGIHMDELRLEQPVGRLIIFEDKTLNVQRMLRPATSTAAAAAPSPASASASSEPFALSLDRLSVTEADLEFADLSLVPQFGTQIHALGGVINGLSTDPASAAQVEMDGKVDDYGSAKVRGSLQPFRATDFTDLKVSFRNLEMNRLTPYSGKFAGRKIDSGKMSADLEYKIKNRQLTGANKFVINTLKLGERVDSPDAVHLPLDLAIALLEDSNGVIDLDLPISGSLDDPQFSYGKVVWKAIVNVISKIATAPFRALGKLLGVGADKLEAIDFETGDTALAPPEQEKLRAVADALAKRPSLALRIAPAYDLAADKASLQETAIRRAVLKEMDVAVNPGEKPGPIDLNNTKVQSAIDNLYKDIKGQPRSMKAVDAVRDYFRKAKPEDVPRYRAMVDELKAATNIPESDLQSVARGRAEAIRSYLTDKAGLASERIKIAEPVKVTGNGSNVPLKMELEAGQVAH